MATALWYTVRAYMCQQCSMRWQQVIGRMSVCMTQRDSTITAVLRQPDARPRQWNRAYESYVVNIVTERWRLIRKSCSHVIHHNGTLIYRTRDERTIIALEVLSEIVPSSLPLQNAETYAETYLLVLGSFRDRWLRTRALNSIIKNDRSNMTY